MMLRQSFAAQPQPLSVPPSESFIGNDGPWSGFELQVGTPPQNVDVFVSTTGSETFVVLSGGCQQLDPSTCPSDRGNIFDISASRTWNSKGSYALQLDTNLGLDSVYDSGAYGLDDIALGWQGSGLPTLKNQTIAGTTSTDFWVGVFGISPYPTNLSGFNPDESIPTYLQTLRDSNSVPSLSWGYTGGAQYRLKNALASLTFGGYDTSLFMPSGVSFDFGTDNNRDLTLYVQSILYTDSSNPDVSLLPSANPGPLLTFIDSTAPAIWLPLPVCQAFEEVFGLTWNDTYGYYFINDTLRATLLASNPNVTFTLSNTATGGPTVNITLPYAAFDKTLSYGIGLINNLPSLESQTYFPLQRAANSSQYTLGKTFLQEAYIITDYERQNFTVNPCIWNQDARQTLVPICSVNTTGCTSPMGSGPAKIPPIAPNAVSPTATPQPGPNFGAGAIAGTIIGALLLTIAALASFFCIRRRHRRREAGEGQNAVGIDPNWRGHGIPEEAQKPHQQVTEIDSSPVAEMDTSVTHPFLSADDGGVKMEYYGEHPRDEVYELPADVGMTRQAARPLVGRHARNGSTGQDSNISELSDGEAAGRSRPNLLHRRNTSDKSGVSDASTLQQDDRASPCSNHGVSPVVASQFTEKFNVSPIGARNFTGTSRDPTMPLDSR
ncbi:hypothetical protein MMC17_009086 [Xylographa soralifera]|nr:hypothetical protein [Xylographa soralifera]